MKFNLKRISSILSMTILFGLATALLIPSIPYAAAINTPGESHSPVTPTQGGTTTITFTPSGVLTPVVQMKVAMFESGEPLPAGFLTGFPTPCIIASVPSVPASNNIWFLERGGVPVELGFSTSATVTYGSGGAPVVTVLGAPASISPAIGAFAWVDVNGVNGIQADNLGRLTTPITPYIVKGCGYEGPSMSLFDLTATIFTQTPVAGEILPIDTTALLIAGASSNPLMALSALAIIAGGAFTLMRFQVIRKNF